MTSNLWNLALSSGKNLYEDRRRICLNDTQQYDVIRAHFESIATTAAPMLLLESFTMGSIIACVSLASFLLWLRPHCFPRVPSKSILWGLLVMSLVHWALSLHQFESAITNRSLRFAFSRSSLDWFYPYDYINAWRVFLPLVTETTLFGFVTILFLTSVYTCFWPMRSQWRSYFQLIIPATATVMYVQSLIHWVISIRFYVLETTYLIQLEDLTPLIIWKLYVALLTLFSLNVVLSDAVVMWRMCVVWDRTRPAIALSGVFLGTTLALNIANIVLRTSRLLDDAREEVQTNLNASETISIYGKNYVGLAAMFLSLASNLLATVLVATKAWLYRRQVSLHLRSAGHRRTLVERVMVLLVESGVVYTAIWLIYCVSFFRTIDRFVFDADDNSYFSPGASIITAVSHLDAAMAQITTIYPLATLYGDNVQTRERDYAVTVTFEVDVERSTAAAQPEGSKPAQPIVPPHSKDDNRPAINEAKHSESESGEVTVSDWV
ncbi:unnamed protein product [Peniophora sp. CBMAI 1063]|nr:unnamed protein product [Peniophora sp. CBMAI 1063]